MTFIGENQTLQTPLAGALSAGLDNIRYDQTLTFTPYVRLVLPMDGFVFWVRYDQVSDSSLAAAGLSAAGLAPVVVPCSVHMATDTDNNEDENLDVSNVVVTTTHEVRPFHDALTNVLWLSTFLGVRFAINSRKSFYQQSNIYHYQGKTVFPSMNTQIIDDATDFDLNTLILSNSTPLWLYLASVISTAVWLPGFTFPLYPKFLLEDNMVPPYGVISPVEGSQKAINLAPTLQPNYTRDQFVTEDVDIILYGCPHQQACDFLDSVLGFILADTTFGINNSPVIKDISRQQIELSVLAQKKKISFQINYHQSLVRDLAVILITSCVPQITVSV